MIKKLIIVFFCISLITGSTTATATLIFNEKVDMLDLFSKIEQKKSFFKKWDKYLRSTMSVSSRNYSNTVFKSKNKWLSLLDDHNTKVKIVRELTKSNEYNNQWVERLKSKISDKELKKRRKEISKTFFYIMLKSHQPYLEESAKEVVYYGRIYFNLVDDYIRVFMSYYKRLPEKERNKNVYFYSKIQEAKNDFEARKSYYLIIADTKYFLLGEMVNNLENKDVYNLLSSEKIFQKPFDLFKALNDLYK
ncbi:MAG: hypothetical protein GY714_10725 [Desulfobacterales bacterium]|nr:hypothetical protein [Desulfobacterales bacterium]